MSDLLACKEYFSLEHLFLLSTVFRLSRPQMHPWILFLFLFVLHIGFAVTPCHGERGRKSTGSVRYF